VLYVNFQTTDRKYERVSMLFSMKRAKSELGIALKVLRFLRVTSCFEVK